MDEIEGRCIEARYWTRLLFCYHVGRLRSSTRRNNPFACKQLGAHGSSQWNIRRHNRCQNSGTYFDCRLGAFATESSRSHYACEGYDMWKTDRAQVKVGTPSELTLQAPCRTGGIRARRALSDSTKGNDSLLAPTGERAAKAAAASKYLITPARHPNQHCRAESCSSATGDRGQANLGLRLKILL